MYAEQADHIFLTRTLWSTSRTIRYLQDDRGVHGELTLDVLALLLHDLLIHNQGTLNHDNV